MALIKCPECDKEISDTIKKCPNCGYKLKKRMNKKSKIIISIFILIAIAIGTIITIVLINNKKQHEVEYNKLLTQTGGKMYLNGVVSELICYDIGQVWYNSIFKKSNDKYDKYTIDNKWTYSKIFNDFSTSIENYKKANNESLQKLKDAKVNLGEDIKKLKDYPNENYKDAYNELVVFYGIFSKLIDSATSPSGTYKDYISTYNNYSKEFNESYNRLIVLKPEIKEYATETK